MTRIDQDKRKGQVNRMKSSRHAAILELIATRSIETQEGLAEALRTVGFQVTQATVSRDIKELRLVKVLTPQGTYQYAQSSAEERKVSDKLLWMLRESMLSAVAAENLIVVKTLSGSANVAAEALDSLGWPELLGTVAGDNTVLLVARSAAEAAAVERQLRDLMS